MLKNQIVATPHSSEVLEQVAFLDAAKRGARYLETIRARRVFPGQDALTALTGLSGELPNNPSDAVEVIALLDEIGSPGTVALGGGRYFGFVCGGTLPAARAAGVLACAWDQNAAMRVLSPTATELEATALRWIVDLLGLPGETAGAFVTGATLASFSCLAAARYHLLQRRGWNVQDDGLFQAPSIPVYVSEHAHASVLKSLALLGFGKNRVIRLQTDSQGRILTTSLPSILPESLVCIQAGDVNSGAFDDAEAICDWAHEADAWVHVDGAFGLWAAACPSLKSLTNGMERADSWATDAHKWLNVTYDCGLALVRKPDCLRSVMSMSAAYLKPSEEHRDPSHWNPELSRRARGVETWAALRSLGRSGLAEMLDRTCRHARRFAVGLADAGFEILNDIVLNQVLVSFGEDEVTDLVTKRLQEDGTCWCGTSKWKGRTVMRISVSSWATTDEDVELSLATMVRIARQSGATADRSGHRQAALV